MTVRSADRTLTIFEAFAEARRPMGLSQLAQRTRIPISSCHTLIATLVDRGYLYTVSDSRSVYPTRRLLEIGERIAHNDPFLERISPALLALRDETGETVIVGKQQRGHVLYLDVIEGLHTIRYTASPGEFKPMHSSAIGKALLSVLDPIQIETWLASNDRLAATAHTLVNEYALRAAIKKSAEQGYAVTHGENVADVNAFAIAVPMGNTWFGIAVAGPSHRMIENGENILSRLLAAKEMIVGSS